MSGYKYHDRGYGPDSEDTLSVDPPVIHGPSSEETTPLLPGKPQRTLSSDTCRLMTYGLLALLAFLFFTVNLYMHFVNCPLYPSTMIAIRHEWEKEAAGHDLLLEKWQLEKQEHAAIDAKWKLEAEWHDRDVARRIREEAERQERARQEWAQEFQRHTREAEEYEKTVAHRVREEQERQERVQKEWDQEVEKHRHECEEVERRQNQRQENEREKWRREVEEHDRIEEERRKREEEERQKLNMFWGGIEAHTCTTYATREYTAQLMNLPATWEHRVEACKATPLEVHGISYLPKSCEDKGPGIVIGTWEINQHEPGCASFWLWYKDKESPSRLMDFMLCQINDHYRAARPRDRRIEHYLENLPRGSDWREFCATTPARFHGMQFPGAQECFQSDGGTYGHWEIDDTNCQ